MTNNLSPSTVACLGDNHGYRFEGDFVHLNAEVSFADTALAAEQAWSLQLWASDQGFSGVAPTGIKVAELPIQPVSGRVLASGYCNAMPPAGAGNQVLGLALVASAGNGQLLVRDLAVYPSGENFLQPSLVGNVACTLAGAAVELSIETIANPRAADNLSGTLALEVWALDAPYAGGAWAGSPVASLVLGVLSGDSEWAACRFTIPAALPVACAALTVMLREWTPAGYVTRDYRNFAGVPTPEAVVTKLETAVAELVAPKPEAVKAETAVKDPAPAKAVTAPKTLPAEKPKAAVVAAKPDAAVKAPVVEVKQPEAKKAAVKAVGTKAAAKPVSVNRASEAELCAVKGLPPSVARAIVAARPFATLEEVCKAKGMGPKMLTKLRDQLAL
jgi:DNA uptake protein ComE-like DNA-binding protein